MEKNKLLSEPVSFNFLQEWPQSQIISGSLSHGQANFYCLIIVQMLIYLFRGKDLTYKTYL